MTTPHRRSLGLLASLALLTSAGCTAPPGGADEDQVPLESLPPDTLHWVAPLSDDALAVGDLVDLTVYSQNRSIGVVHFAVDGTEVDACDPSAPDQDCFDADNWATAVVFDAPGAHTITASYTTSGGATAQITRQIDVRASAESPDEQSSDPTRDTDPLTDDQLVDEGSGQIVQALTARGFLDPPEPMGPAACHRRNERRACDPSTVQGCQSWSVQGQRVVLDHARLDGSTAELDRCYEDFGASIARYADVQGVSRAAVTAWLAAAGNCSDACPRWQGQLIAGARCAATARALGLSLDARTCRARAKNDADFAIEIAVEYLHRTAQRHHHDPVLAAALIHHGAHRQRGDINNWCAGAGSSSGAFITRFVAAYNAYRTWERRFPIDPGFNATNSSRLAVGYSGWSDLGIYRDPQYAQTWGNPAMNQARLCHAYPRYDVALLDPSHADRVRFDQWYRAVTALDPATGRPACDQLSVAFKADNQQYSRFPSCFSGGCGPGEACGDDGMCEPHRPLETPAQHQRYEDAFVAFRAAWPAVHYFSTWNEPNNSGSHQETGLTPESAAELYLRGRSHCDPSADCHFAAGDFFSWTCTLGGVTMGCSPDPNRLCTSVGPGGDRRATYLDRFKYYVDHHSQGHGALPAHFRPEYWGFHPWHDSYAYTEHHSHCSSTHNCMTRALLESLGGEWSHSELWATEVGVRVPPALPQGTDFTRACGESFLLRLFSISPRITRFYDFLAGDVVGMPSSTAVLRDRNGHFDAACP